MNIEKFGAVKLARANGCTSATVRGLVKWIAGHSKSASVLDQRMTHRGTWLIARQMTRACLPYIVGDATPHARHRGWIGVTVQDSDLRAESESQSEVEFPRAKNFDSGVASLYGPSFSTDVTTDRTTYGGSFKGWEHTSRTPRYQSGLWVSARGVVVILGQKCKITHRHYAPAGLKFAKDGEGVKILAKDGTDYHPTLHEWRSSRFAGMIREKLTAKRTAVRAAAALKRTQARVEAVFQRDLSTTRVNLDDSRRAGNCIEGSLAFAERRLSMTRSEILDGGWLVSVSGSRLAKTGDARALAAVRSAWARETTVSI